ncbi:ABC transporter ATP-binding protein [Chloroflexota bacterium]
MLQLDKVTRNFHGLVALNSVSMQVPTGQVTGLIGPNGAGKTTLLNCVSGLDHATDGKIVFDGQNIERLSVHRITALGMTRTYQNIRLFPEMTVLQNMIVAQHLQGRASILHSIFQLPVYYQEEKRLRQHAQDILVQYGLSDVQDVPATTLSYGDQRRLEMARALIAHPRLMLLDEPTAGMNPIETEELGRKILEMKAAGITVLVIEHDMALISQVCDTVYVLNFGTIMAHGTPDEVKANPQVIEAYLGKDD